ncbi:MAG: hypothetical protein ACJ8C4_00260 [Gemmataceae bacterium]
MTIYRSWLALLLIAPAVSAADPIPIRRQVAADERAALAREQQKPGALVRMPRDKFEERVARAAAGLERQPAQLIDTTYRARLDAEHLRGSARWTVRTAAGGSHLLPLEPWNAALTAAKWADGGAAIVGELGKPLADPGLQVLVERNQTLLELEWSLQSRREAGGLHFDLRIPPCALSTLELELPAGMELMQAAGVHRPTTDRPTWLVNLGGQSSVSFLIRTAPGVASTPSFVIQRNLIELRTGAAELNYQLDLNFGQTGKREIELVHEPGVVPLDVVGPTVARWEPIEASSRVRVIFDRPVESATVTLRAIMPINMPGVWTVPAVSVTDGLANGETLTIHVSPVVALEEWRSGNMRLTGSEISPLGEQHIHLASHWDKVEGTRPSGRMRSAVGDWQVKSRLDWQIESERQTLVADLSIVPQRASMATFAFLLSTNWDVEAVDTPNGEGVQWSVQNDQLDRRVLRLTFDPALAAHSIADVRVHLHAEVAGPRLVFPNLAPLAGRQVQSSLKVAVSPVWHSESRPSLSLSREKNSGLGGESFASIGGPIEGWVILSRPVAELAAHGIGDITSTRSGPHWDYRLRIEPKSSAIDSVLLHCSLRNDGPWNWQSETSSVRIRRVVRIDLAAQASALFAADWPLGAISPVLAPNSGSLWLISLDRPVSGPLELRLTGDTNIAPIGRSLAAFGMAPWGVGFAQMRSRFQLHSQIPLWSVVNSAGQRHDWSVAEALAADTGYLESQLHEVATPRGRVFRHGEDFNTHESSANVGVTRMALTNPILLAAWAGDGKLICRYEARITGMRDGSLRMELPSDAQWLSATLDGAAVPVMTLSPMVRACKPSGQELAVSYILPAPAQLLFTRVTAEAPSFSCDAPPPRVRWSVPDHFVTVPSRISQPTSETLVPRVNNVEIGSIPIDTAQPLVSSTSSTLWIIRPAVLQLCSALLAIGALAALLICRSKCVVVLAAVLVGIGITWLPLAMLPIVWGLVLICGVSLVWLGARRWTLRAAVLVITAMAWPSVAAGPEPAIVTIVTASDGSETALAPTELLDRLDLLARRGEPTADMAVLSALYTGQANNTSARIEARWEVLSFHDQVEFEIPVAGGQLAELRLNDEPIYPQTTGLRARISLGKAGRFTITAHLVVPTVTEPARRVATFEVPAAPIAKLDVALPAGAKLADPLPGRGAAIFVNGRATIDLGNVSTIELCWQPPAKNMTTVEPKIREGYLWDLSAPAAKLYGTVRCQFSSGSSHEVRIALRRGVEVAGVRSVDPRHLRSWRIDEANENRTIVADVTVPGAGLALVALELTPREPIAMANPLPYPSVANASETFWAWRGEPGTTPGRTNGVGESATESYVRDFLLPEQGPGPPTKVYRRRATGAQIRVAPPPEVTWTGPHTMRWRLGSRRAFVEVSAQVAAEPLPRSMIEWEVPGNVTVQAVDCPGLVSWSRAGTRLQLWFADARKSATVVWQGTINRNNPEAPLELPSVRLIGATPGSIVEITSRPGWELTPTFSQAVKQDPSSIPGWRWRYVCDKSYYKLAFQPWSTLSTTQYTVATQVSSGTTGPISITTVEAHIPKGEMTSFGVRVKAGAKDIVQIEAADATLSDETSSAGERAWMVHPGSGGDHQLKITVRPKVPTTSWSVPVVSLTLGDSAPAKLDRSISLTPELNVVEARGLESAGANWRVLRDDWHMTVQPQSTDSEAIRVGLLDTVALREPTGDWRVRSTAWLTHEANAELVLKWEQAHRINAIDIDGQHFSTPRGPTKQIILLFNGPPGPRRVRWEVMAGAGEIAEPSSVCPEMFVNDRRVEPDLILWSRELGATEQPAPTRELLSAANASKLRNEALRRMSVANRTDEVTSEVALATGPVATWRITDAATFRAELQHSPSAPPRQIAATILILGAGVFALRRRVRR